jgi:putative transposase
MPKPAEDQVFLGAPASLWRVFLQQPPGRGRQGCMVTQAQKQASAVRRASNRERGRKRASARVRARPILPGRSYKVTKRCNERRMYLVPGRGFDYDPKGLAGFIGYCLAYCANCYGIQIHACVFMSNHYHIDLSDPHANLVEFKRLLNSMIARGVNACENRKGSFWDRDVPADTQRPIDDQSFLDLVYTIANPVSAGLVRHSHQWGGFTTAGWRFGESRAFRRPDGYFDKKGQMPESVVLTLVRPAIYLELSDDELFARLEAELHRRELEICNQMRRSSRRFMGPRKAQGQRFGTIPRSFEERFTVTPRVAASCRWRLLAQLQRNRAWEREYADARARLLAGETAVFPAGTYFLRRFAGVSVAQLATC